MDPKKKYCCSLCHTVFYLCFPLGQQSPTFLVPGTGFMEDILSIGVGGMVQVVMRVVVQAVT